MNENVLIVAFVGKKRSGKDTAGNYFVSNHGYTYAQKLAAPIKDIGRMLFGWSQDMVEGVNYNREQLIPELGMSVRQFLQECGSLFKYDLSDRIPDYGDKVGPKIWAEVCARWLDKQKPGQYVLTDVRFPEEIQVLKSKFKHVYVVKLISNRSPEDKHISETAVDTVPFNFCVVNDGYDTYSQLYAELDAISELINDQYYTVETGKGFQT